ncbi:unnamed protein product [Prunus armeniaca]
MTSHEVVVIVVDLGIMSMRWIQNLNRCTDEYLDGIEDFIVFARTHCLCLIGSDHQPPDQGIKCVPTAKGPKPTIRVVAGICRDLWGSHHHASQPQTTMLHNPKCRFDYPLAPVGLHHAGLISLECPSRTPINTKLRTTFKGFKHQNQKPPTEQIIFSCNALSIPLFAFLGVVVDCKKNPFINISYDP